MEWYREPEYCAIAKCDCKLTKVCLDSDCNCSRIKACRKDRHGCGRLEVCEIATCECDRPKVRTNENTRRESEENEIDDAEANRKRTKIRSTHHRERIQWYLNRAGVGEGFVHDLLGGTSERDLHEAASNLRDAESHFANYEGEMIHTDRMEMSDAISDARESLSAARRQWERHGTR